VFLHYYIHSYYIKRQCHGQEKTVFAKKKSPPHRDGDFICTDHTADQSAVNGINATLRARLIAVVSSR
jgi:hypothetical protein